MRSERKAKMMRPFFVQITVQIEREYYALGLRASPASREGIHYSCVSQDVFLRETLCYGK